MKSGLNSTSSSASPARTWSSNLGNLNTTFPEVFVSVLFFETAAISLTESAAECSLVEPARSGISRSVALGKTPFLRCTAECPVPDWSRPGLRTGTADTGAFLTIVDWSAFIGYFFPLLAHVVMINVHRLLKLKYSRTFVSNCFFDLHFLTGTKG